MRPGVVSCRERGEEKRKTLSRTPGQTLRGRPVWGYYSICRTRYIDGGDGKRNRGGRGGYTMRIIDLSRSSVRSSSSLSAVEIAMPMFWRGVDIAQRGLADAVGGEERRGGLNDDESVLSHDHELVITQYPVTLLGRKWTSQTPKRRKFVV